MTKETTGCKVERADGGRMNTISFRNRGLIDLRAVRTFGVSVKETENPIGFFGTGLKYAIAICLRLGCKVTLWRGEERIDFVTSVATVRGVEFNVVRMVSEFEDFELGFTTELGKTWEPWQAFRELYCNTIDEHGEIIQVIADPSPDTTTIWITGDAFVAAYHDRDRIALQGEPRWDCPEALLGTAQIHDRPTEFAYVRGIRVGKLQHEAALTYDIRGALPLTEDRSLANIYQYYSCVRHAILRSDNAELIEKFLTAPANSFEAQLDLDQFTTPSETFLQVLENLAFRDCHSLSARVLYKKHRKCLLTPVEIPLNVIEAKQLRKAIDFCVALDYPVTDYPIIVTGDLGEYCWGQAYEGKIYINRSAFAHGTKVVAGTLIEEHCHLRHKFADESRGFQNFLINALVSMGELVIGEPL